MTINRKAARQADCVNKHYSERRIRTGDEVVDGSEAFGR